LFFAREDVRGGRDIDWVRWENAPIFFVRKGNNYGLRDRDPIADGWRYRVLGRL
jgi:hypothetical protein